jgi:hypothetical protein
MLPSISAKKAHKYKFYHENGFLKIGKNTYFQQIRLFFWLERYRSLQNQEKKQSGYFMA